MLAFTLFSFAAFLLAIFLVVAIAVVAASAVRWPGWSLSFLMFLMAVASIATIVFSGRILTAGSDGLTVTSEGGLEGYLLVKVLLAVIVGCSFALSVTWFFFLRDKVKEACRFRNKQFEPPTDIVIAFMAFLIAVNILPIFLGKHYYFHINLIYSFFVYLAIFLWIRLSKIDPVTVAKLCLVFIVFSSLIAAALIPHLALQIGYNDGLIPGFNIRLWGVTSHANTLGAAACVLFLLEAAEPSARVWLRRSILIVTGLALIMTQSKTSILAAFIGLVIIFVGHMLAKSRDQSGYSREIVIGLVVIFSALFAVIAVWTMFYDWGISTALNRNLSANAVYGLSSATGRTDIWEVAIAAGMENPLFGQGGDFWNQQVRLRSGFGGATSAHNLFLEIFSRSGFVGLITLLIFLFFLVRYSLRASKNTNGGSIALMVAFFVRAMFESTIDTDTVLTGSFFGVIAYFIYVMDRGAKPIRNTNKSEFSMRAHFDRTVHSK
ncbi:MAG: O-antigen ligase family protein [Gammaproteobacteria bacterium]|nr:MAG: O-antigen ligase family protein [Gammaproteobacteria bacterium]